MSSPDAPPVDRVLSAWFAAAPSGDADGDQLIEAMRRHAEKLGWTELLERFRATQPTESPAAHALIELGRRLAAQTLTYEQAAAEAKALALPGGVLAVLALHVSCERSFLDDGSYIGLLRLAAD